LTVFQSLSKVDWDESSAGVARIGNNFDFLRAVQV